MQLSNLLHLTLLITSVIALPHANTLLPRDDEVVQVNMRFVPDKLNVDSKTIQATFTGSLPPPAWIGPSGKQLKDTLKPFLANAANINAKYKKVRKTEWEVEAFVSGRAVLNAAAGTSIVGGVEGMKKAVNALAGEEKVVWPSSISEE